jgi:hypothetical protein
LEVFGVTVSQSNISWCTGALNLTVGCTRVSAAIRLSLASLANVKNSNISPADNVMSVLPHPPLADYRDSRNAGSAALKDIAALARLFIGHSTTDRFLQTGL